MFIPLGGSRSPAFIPLGASKSGQSRYLKRIGLVVISDVKTEGSGEVFAEGTDARAFARMMSAADVGAAVFARFVVAAFGVFTADVGLRAFCRCLLQVVWCRAGTPGDVGEFACVFADGKREAAEVMCQIIKQG